MGNVFFLSDDFKHQDIVLLQIVIFGGFATDFISFFFILTKSVEVILVLSDDYA